MPKETAGETRPSSAATTKNDLASAIVDDAICTSCRTMQLSCRPRRGMIGRLLNIAAGGTAVSTAWKKGPDVPDKLESPLLHLAGVRSGLTSTTVLFGEASTRVSIQERTL